MVIDVRADDRMAERDVEAFAVTARVCALLGWEFRRVGEVESVLRGNLRWLARYRHPRCAGRGEIVHRLRATFAGSAPLLAGAEEVGDRLAVLPVLFHLMWCQELVADLAQARLGPATVVRTADAVGGLR